MKRTLLFATALVATAGIVSAQAVDESSYSSRLKLEWFASTAAIDNGDGNTARAGVGTNGKFYVVKQNDGVYVADRNGLTGKKFASSTAWVSINCDDAGHVYFRNDKPGWAGQNGDGTYVSGNAQFCVIDAKTDEWVKQDVSLAGGPGCRFDELPHIKGDMTTDFFEMICPMAFLGSYYSMEDFTFMNLEPLNQFQVLIPGFFDDTDWPTPGQDGSSAYVTTVANAQVYADGKLAFLPNPNYNMSFWGNGYGNNIGTLEFNEDEEEWEWKGNYLNLPNHSGVGGFHIFEYAGEHYVVYPSGEEVAGQPSADGFCVNKLEFVKSGENDPSLSEEQINNLVAIKFGTAGISTPISWRGINVEPIEGEDGKFTLYFYSPGAVMEVWTLDLSDLSGVNDIIATEEAPVEYYNIMGQRVDASTKGLVIKKQGSKATKVIL